MIYLDNSATTRTLEAAAQIAKTYMTEEFFNASAGYAPAVNAERGIGLTRERLAGVLNVTSDEILYTSGGTESNNMAILGSLKAMRAKGEVLVSAVEHPSVYETVHDLSGRFVVRDVGVDREGMVDLDAFVRMISPSTLLVSVMHVNNETGAVNDIPAIYSMLKRKAPNALLHVDGVQAFLKVPLDGRFCDFYSVSGHKFHAPKGVGALYVKKHVRFAGGQTGGGQEKNLRSGTINTPGIMGMDAAIDFYTQSQHAHIANMRACKLRLAENLLSSMDGVIVNGPEPGQGAPHILNISFMGVRGQVLLNALEEKKIYVSTGSACSARKRGKNRILTAMGVNGDRQDGAIRFSFCPFNTLEEMDEAAEEVKKQVEFLRRYKRR